MVSTLVKDLNFFRLFTIIVVYCINWQVSILRLRQNLRTNNYVNIIDMMCASNVTVEYIIIIILLSCYRNEV